MKKTARYVLPVVFLMILPVIVFAGKINLPKTGQTTCYDEHGDVIDCADTGQDGDIQAGVEWPSLRFTDNNDGTVTDNLTGLMWLKDGKCFRQLGWWPDPLDVVTDFNTSPLTYNCSDYTANYDDWRLPNIVELESLVNTEKSNPATWLNTQGFTNVQPYIYWSATIDAMLGLGGWSVDMEKGGITGGHYAYVWPVRGGQSGPAQTWQAGQTTSYAGGVSWPAPRFEDNGDGTITDHLTGLIWLKKADCFGREIWSQALADCNNLASGSCGLSDGSIAGDWRLPNRKELFSLIDYSRYDPALPQGHLFDNVWSDYDYWSATTDARISFSVWTVYMYDGHMISRGKGGFPGATGTFVWPVRAGQGGPVIADFKADLLDGFSPLTVQFTDLSSGSINSWYWDFGDGTSSSSHNPQHVFSSPGTYTVSLTVTGPNGSDTESKADYINVKEIKAVPWIPLLLLDD